MAALTGIRVVDFSRVLAGPHCAKTLLDLGAEVIKIEPPRGDMARSAFPRRGEISGYYAQQNAGKRNISIDLKVDGARDIALRETAGQKPGLGEVVAGQNFPTGHTDRQREVGLELPCCCGWQHVTADRTFAWGWRWMGGGCWWMLVDAGGYRWMLK